MLYVPARSTGESVWCKNGGVQLGRKMSAYASKNADKIQNLTMAKMQDTVEQMH